MAAARRVAALDCGTNTVRLLIADVDASGPAAVREVVRELRTVRLGEGIERTGRFGTQALQRTDQALGEYAALIDEHGAEQIRMVATSASRDVSNSHELVDIVRTRIGIEPEVISGDAEGRLTFSGVLSGLSMDAPCLVLDVGGGSTELIVGDRDGARRAVSMNLGVVRQSERHVHSDPPQDDELARVAQDTRAALAQVLPALGDARGLSVIGVAGTATTAAAIAHGLDSYDPALIHGSRTPMPELVGVREWTCRRTTAQRRDHPAMHPGRAAVFPAGMVILQTVLETLHADELIVSESDILDGVALSIVVPH